MYGHVKLAVRCVYYARCLKRLLVCQWLILLTLRLFSVFWMTQYKYIIIVISRSELRDRDWSSARHVMFKNKQCCPVSSVQRHVPGHHGVNHVTPCICVDFWSDRSIRQINTYFLLLHHGWRHRFVAFISWYITKQILTVSLDQHWKIVPLSCAMLPSCLWPSSTIAQLRGIIFQCCHRHQLIFV